MTTFVLTHGAWGGAYGFRKLRPLLWQEGHEVFTPSLTGIGERSHLTAPWINLSTHVTDLVNLIRYEDLNDIVLLGFSYGGMVVTGALDQIGDRVRHLVYLDAFVPSDGQSAADLVGMAQQSPALDPGSSWLLPPIPRQLDDPAETAWSNERRSEQPVKTFTEPAKLSKPLQDWPFTLSYIKATEDQNEQPDSPFWKAARAAEQSSRWTYHEIGTNHLIPFERPADLAAILLDICAGV